MYAAFVADEANVGSVNRRVRVGFDKASAGGFFDKTYLSSSDRDSFLRQCPRKTCWQQRTRTWRSLLRRAHGRTHLSSTSSVWLKQPPLAGRRLDSATRKEGDRPS